MEQIVEYHNLVFIIEILLVISAIMGYISLFLLNKNHNIKPLYWIIVVTVIILASQFYRIMSYKSKMNLTGTDFILKICYTPNNIVYESDLTPSLKCNSYNTVIKSDFNDILTATISDKTYKIKKDNFIAYIDTDSKEYILR